MEEKLFLEENYKEELKNYKDITFGIKKTDWDWIIITASNTEQKQSYIEQIEYRKKINFFPKNLKIDVIEDPEGRRVGSGGATLNVLKFLSENDKDFLNKKILLIHSGGDSKRVPTCSACGKLFSNIPRKLFNNRCSTLFDEFMISFANVPSRLKNGILVLSGDVLLLFNSLQIDIHDFDVASISIKVPVEIGKNHGVVLADANNNVKKFLHKLSVAELKKFGAVDNEECVNLDTGCIWMNSKVVQSLFELISENNIISNEKYNQYINETNRLSFYGDLLYPFSNEGTLEEYLTMPAEGAYDENLKNIRKTIWKKLNNYSFGVVKTSPSKFIHAGTTQELMKLFIEAKEGYSYLDWDNIILSNKNYKNVSCINSYLEKCQIKSGTLVEHSIVKENSIIEENCLISNTIFKGHLLKNTVIHTLPINYDNEIKYVTRIYSVFDNPKNNNMFLNESIENFEKNNNLDFNKESLWDIKIYPICETLEESVEQALIIQKMVNNKASNEEKEYWKNLEKMSLKESFNIANTKEILKHQESIEYKILADKIVEEFINKKISVEKIMLYMNEYNVKEIFKIIDKAHKEDYKINLLLSSIIKKYNYLFEPNEKNLYEDKCYNLISKKIIEHNKVKVEEKTKIVSEEITNEFPVRLNFGGGWSDTAPYCLENGGTVLNAAVSLNGKLPIKVSVKKNNANKFIFISKDANKIKEYNSVKEFEKLDLIGDVFILTKAAILLLNINDDILKETGITIVTDVDVPKGSGLGTSSILSAGIIKTLSEFCGYSLSTEEIASLVLCAEQMISSGGGWQDQLGGLTDGIKVIETQKGSNQNYKITYIDKTSRVAQELDKKLVLIYAGQRRIAKNLLRKIMNKYILNDSKTIKTLKHIQYLSLLMKFELEKGTIEGFSNLLNSHFELSKELDEGVTNMCINHLISTTQELMEAHFIAGAGGGGFIIGILKDETKKEELKTKIATVYKDIGIEVFDCRIKWE